MIIPERKKASTVDSDSFKYTWNVLMGLLSSDTLPRSPALAAQNLNHWTTKKVLGNSILIYYIVF